MDLEMLKAECDECTACKLSETRHNVVFGEGSENAKLMFVGEGPGETEDLTGRPFVGKAGMLLDKMLLAAEIEREKVYIANIVKCRPPHNRDPEQSEEDACIEHLRNQVRIIRPQLIVCLGRIAACRLISPDFKVTRQHGQLIKKGNIMFIGTYHPSALLRNPENKPAAFEDMLKIAKIYKESL